MPCKEPSSLTVVRLAHPVFSLSREQRRDGRPPIFFSGVLNTQNSDNTVCSTTCRYSILIIQIVDYIFYINIYSKNEQEKIIIITLKVLAFLRAFSQVAVLAPCLLICQIYYFLIPSHRRIQHYCRRTDHWIYDLQYNHSSDTVGSPEQPVEEYCR